MAPPKRLLLVGAGGHGRVVADLAEECGWADLAFVDDAWPGRSENANWPIVGSVADLHELRRTYEFAIVSIGENRSRLELHRRLADLEFEIPVLVHPRAVISRYARLGKGSVACANVVVNAFTEIGEAVILNTAATVDHDCVVGDGAHVAPGAKLAGEVTAAACSWIGIGASVREGIAIAEDAMIGAGSAVVRDVAASGRVVGVPARPHRG